MRGMNKISPEAGKVNGKIPQLSVTSNTRLACRSSGGDHHTARATTPGRRISDP